MIQPVAISRPPFSRVAVLLFDRAALFETSVPMSVFGVDRRSTGAPGFTVSAIGAEPGPLTTTAGLELHAPHGLDAIHAAEVVIVPTWRDPLERPPQAALDALASAHDAGVTIVGLCLGAFVLAAAGILDGRRAATHWLHAPTLAALYPDVRVDADALFIDDGDVITSAGTAAGIDACLHLVRSAFGARSANAIARRMVVAPQRSGGQAQFVEAAIPERRADHVLSEVLERATRHLDEVIDVDALAASANMSRRTFDRRFRELTGTSPQQWWLHQRVLHAQRLLEDTDLSVELVARHVGFGTAVSLRPHFRRVVGISPREYRDRFR